MFKLGLKLFSTFVVGFIWLYVMVIQVPLLLTAGGLGWFVGVALAVFSVIVVVLMATKIVKTKTQTTTSKE